MDRRPTHILYITRRFPSATFVVREVLELARDPELDVRILSDELSQGSIELRTASGEIVTGALPPEIEERTTYYSQGAADSFASQALSVARYPIRSTLLARLLIRTQTTSKHKIRDRLRDLFLALNLRNAIRETPIDRIHADFGSQPATLALVLARLLRVPFTFTVHAQDAYSEPMLLKEKIAAAAAVATCTHFNRTHLVEVARPVDRHKIVTVHHGIDFDAIDFRAKQRNDVPRLLAVGRMVAYKGFAYLVDALDLLRQRGTAFKGTIIGNGPDFRGLQARIREKGLADCVILPGVLTFAEVKRHFEEADVFVAPSVTTEDIGFDGLPNVILEAMASRTAIVASRISAIPEAIRDGESGLLVEQRDPSGLAQAIQRLLDDQDLRWRMGEGGYRFARRAFDLRTNVQRLKQVILGRGADLAASEPINASLLG